MLCFHTLRRVARVAVTLLRLTICDGVLHVVTVTASSVQKTEVEFHTGWTACHASAVINFAYGCTPNNRRRSNITVPFVMMNISKLPTTAMAVLIDNQQIPIAHFNNITMHTIYNSQNLGKIPDIHVTGRDYYTLLYQIEIPCTDATTTAAEISRSRLAKYANETLNRSYDYQKVYLKFAGINYRATVWYNGIQLPNLQYQYFDTPLSSIHPNIPGMFLRHRYDITPTQSQSDCFENTNLLVVMIEPPFHPGYPIPGQQGGSHDLAQDGAIPQYMLGWDWCTSMPDRATGFYGAVTLYTQQHHSPLLRSFLTGSLHDPAIQTVNLSNCSWTRYSKHSRYSCSDITLRMIVQIEWSIIQQQQRLWKLSDADTNITLIIESDWGEIWRIQYFSCCETDDCYVDLQENFTVVDATKVKLWWPHGVGISTYAHTHNFNISLHVNEIVTDVMILPVGIRTIDTYLDNNIQGQRFRVNHHDIYLVGGNWIGSDQALRYSASKQRYCDEILLHQYAGLNLIRVWGGSTAERDQFYECADHYGMLVYQEFWMTGDNNGRWAGNYSWPLDYTAYLVNVEDTIKRLRQHPSLLFYGGCNECLSPRASSWAPNPPRLLDDGIRSLFEKFDPGRFYISSSMGGPNKGDSFYEPSMYRNRTFSLAYADGPYGMLLSSNFYDRNPGQPFRNISIGFQPEIGSVSIPSSNGLLKFLSAEEIQHGYPRRNASTTVGEAWTFHNFLQWTTLLHANEFYDHVYAYFEPSRTVLAADWNAAAQLAAHVQYQHLLNGFICRIFHFTSGVVIWKTQSPWPSMRGFLYDWYMESTGMMTGTRSALWSPVSVVLNLQSWQLILVNRQVVPIFCIQRQIGVQYTWIDIHGKTVSSGAKSLPSDIVPAMSTTLLDFDHQPLQWPKWCTFVCFLRLEGVGGCDYDIPPSWYWLTDPEIGHAGNYSLLGELRSRQAVLFDWDVVNCDILDSKISLEVTLKVHSQSSDILLYPSFSMFRPKDNSQMLPLVDLNHNDMVILPGTPHSRTLESTAHHISGETISIKLASWNGPDEERLFAC